MNSEATDVTAEVASIISRFEKVQEGVGLLRRFTSPSELTDHVCRIAAEYCLFDGAMLSKVEGSWWRPWRGFSAVSRANGSAFIEWVEESPRLRLDHLLLESDMVRRRKSAIVIDALCDPRVSAEFIRVSPLTSYVAAPVVAGRKVVGLLHADHVDRQVDETDRATLGLFANAFGLLHEQVTLISSLSSERQRVRESLAAVHDTMVGPLLSAAELGASRVGEPSTRHDEPEAGPGGPNQLHGDLRMLTARELDVLDLLATGATNAEIATSLVLSLDTVKSHIKKIFRKTRVENRSEATALYLRSRLSGQQPSGSTGR